MTQEFTPFDKVLEDYRNGKMVILLDHVDRENEGDLAIATEFVTTEALAFMANHARGLICTSIGPEIAERLNIPLQVTNNNAPFNTPFALTIDHKTVAGRGVLLESRAKTMRALVDPNATADDFVSPGHVFPLIANPAGVIARQGQTEGSSDLARLAGLQPSGVICEIMNPDGTVMKGQALHDFAKEHNIAITWVPEIIKYRIQGEALIRKVAENICDTEFGTFRALVFKEDVSAKEHMALVYGDLSSTPTPLVRIHSECLTGDVFGSLRCDCGEQLARSARMIQEAGAGIILYLRQEGRGIGLGNKLKAYALQDMGLDTVEANEELGFAADERDFIVAARILQALSVSQVRLMTNNPDKLETLQQHGIQIVERVQIIVEPTDHSRGYLEAKRTKLGHLY